MVSIPGWSSTPVEMEGDNDNFPVLLNSGDLRLHVTYSNQYLTWSGSSSSLSQASPVWNKMLGPPVPVLSIRRIDGGYNDMREKEIDLSDDSGEALLILLRIAHCQFSKVPASLESKTILDMAVLCDKYDCVGLVNPWLNLWLVNEQKECSKPGHEEWLFIAWVFGRENIFEALARKLQREMTVNECGDGLTSTGEIFPNLMSPDIIGMLLHSLSKPVSNLSANTHSAFRKHDSHPRRYDQRPPQVDVRLP